MKIEAVIFDYGGVLCFHPPDEQIGELAARAGAPHARFVETYWALRFEYDRGDVTYVEYWREFGRRVGRDYSERDIDEFVQLDVAFWLHVDQRMVEWARSLRRAGRKVALLSNMPRELGEHMKSQFAWLRDFDHLTLSYEVRAAKPEPAIYRDAVEGLGVAPEKALFLDDRAENVEAARAFGLRAARFESAEAFRSSAREAHDFLGLGAPPILLE